MINLILILVYKRKQVIDKILVKEGSRYYQFNESQKRYKDVYLVVTNSTIPLQITQTITKWGLFH